ncbi:glycosyltransferase family 4 protein [Candidatus Curtissbacteria bacterium]|nr:glycosyltransferase family 4 protein [Candidatus Curtissbacteria bacterium]
MKESRILFVYRTPRKHVLESWEKAKMPDSLLFGANHLIKKGYKIDFFDSSYSIFNPFHPLFYPLEHSIIHKVGMGFKIDQAIRLMPKLRDYDIIVATGDSAGLPILALKYCGVVKTPIIFMTAGLAGALKGNENSWVGKFYKKILRMPDVFTAYSQIEIDFFVKKMGIPKGKIEYMPLGTDWDYFSKKQKRKTTKNVICAVGVDSGRDYGTLFRAVEDLPYEIEVACHPSNIKGLKIPNNVKVHLNAPITEVKEIFDRSLISIVPCYERFRSAGQMVILESGSAGLPVIASKIAGITSAFKFKNKKEILFFEPENADDLRNKIKLLIQKPKTAQMLGKSISQTIHRDYTTKVLARNLASYIDNL